MSSINEIRAFQILGCKDYSKCALGARLYLDLECDKRVTKLEKCYDSQLKLAFVRGERDETVYAFIPVGSNQLLNFYDVEKWQAELKNTDANCSGIVLGICDTSSNILYYQVAFDFDEKKY